MASLHHLNCVDYLSATVTNGGCTSKRRAGYGKPFDTGKGGLKRTKIVCWFPFLAIPIQYTIMV